MRLALTLAVSLFTLPLAAPVAADPPQVLADTRVTGALVQQVLGDLGEVEVLLDKGSDPHDFQLRPSQARALQQADLLVWIGPELTPWLSRGAETLAPERRLALLATPGTTLRSYGESDAHEADDGHDHAPGSIDPHAWLDPTNAAVWLDEIAGRLSALDPDHASAFAENAETAKQQIAQLDTRLTALLAPLAGQQIVTLHDAYGYFTAHYGLAETIPVSLGDASAPSAARIDGIRRQIAEQQVRCAFPEANHPSAVLDAVTSGSPVVRGEPLDPEGSQIDAESGFYTELLSQLAERIHACLSAK